MGEDFVKPDVFFGTSLQRKLRGSYDAEQSFVVRFLRYMLQEDEIDAVLTGDMCDIVECTRLVDETERYSVLLTVSEGEKMALFVEVRSKGVIVIDDQ